MIDGLYVTGEALVVVQPWQDGRFVSRLDLNHARSEIVGETPLLSDHPLLDQPTTGAVVGTDVYVILNAHLQTFRGLWADERLDEAATLSVPTILRLPLREPGEMPA